jgi:DNA repair protein RadC
MTRREAVPLLQAILEDTLGPDDDRDTKRIKAVELAIAVLQNDRRPRRRFPEGAVKVCSPREAYGHVRYLGRQVREHLVGLYLDAQNCLIVRETLSMGTLNTTRTHPREILQPAILNHALGLILAHNHPSGDLTPSKDDEEFTRAVRRAAEVMEIDLHDHLIIGKNDYVSLRERGLF